MASNIYTITTVTGEKKTYRRSIKQGRPKAVEIDKAVCVSMSPTALAVIDKKAESANMSRSAWLEMAGLLYSKIA